LNSSRDSASVTKQKKEGPEESRADKGNATMSNLPLNSTAATKVIAKACAWADRRKAVQLAPEGREKAREAGRYEVSGKELAVAVEHYRKQAGE
jgi:hypothetical protein